MPTARDYPHHQDNHPKRSPAADVLARFNASLGDDWRPKHPNERRCERCGHIHRTKNCRRRSCPDGTLLWSPDVRTVVMAATNVLDAGGGVRMFPLTAPGADRLPWDESKCTEPPGHHHDGRKGCRVNETWANIWEAAVAGNWRRLHEAAQQHRHRRGFANPYIGIIDEDQARGVRHRNVLVEEGPGGRAYFAYICANAHKYGFGFVDRKRNVKRGPLAVAYLCGYLLSKHSSTKRAKGTDLCAAALRIKDPRCRLWAVSPRLTKQSGVTMGSIRRGRQVWAAKQGFCPMPTAGKAVVDWYIVDCGTGEIFDRCFPSRTGDDVPRAAA